MADTLKVLMRVIELLAFALLIILFTSANTLQRDIYTKNTYQISDATKLQGDTDTKDTYLVSVFAYVLQQRGDDPFSVRRTIVMLKQLVDVHLVRADVVVFTCGHYGYPLKLVKDLFSLPNLHPLVEYARRHNNVKLVTLQSCKIHDEASLRSLGHETFSPWDMFLQCTFCFLGHTMYRRLIFLGTDIVLTRDLDYLFEAIQPGYMYSTYDISTRLNQDFMAIGNTDRLGGDLQDSFLASTTFTCRGGVNNSEWNRPYFIGKCQESWNKCQSFLGVYFTMRSKYIVLDRKYDFVIAPKHFDMTYGLPMQDVEVFHWIGCKDSSYRDLWDGDIVNVRRFCRRARSRRFSKMCNDIGTLLCFQMMCYWRELDEAIEREDMPKPLFFPKQQLSPKWATHKPYPKRPQRAPQCGTGLKILSSS